MLAMFTLYWHERSALQSVAVRRLTGNDVSGHYFHRYFSFPFFFSLEMANNLGLDPFPDPVGHFGFASGAVLRAVSEYPRRC